MTKPVAHETRESLSHQVRIFSGDQEPCKLCAPCVKILDQKILKKVNNFAQSAFFISHVSPLLKLDPSSPTEAQVTFTDKTITVETGSGNRSKKVTISLNENGVSNVFEGLEVTTNTRSTSDKPKVFAGGADVVRANQDILNKADAIWKGCRCDCGGADCTPCQLNAKDLGRKQFSGNNYTFHTQNSSMGHAGNSLKGTGGEDRAPSLNLPTDLLPSTGNNDRQNKINLGTAAKTATNPNSIQNITANPQLDNSTLNKQESNLVNLSISEIIPNKKEKTKIPFGGQQLFPQDVTDEFNSKKPRDPRLPAGISEEAFTQ